MKINSYSKVNIFLNVQKTFIGNKHTLEGVFVLNKTLFDIIEINPSNDFCVYYIKNDQPLVIPNDVVSKIVLWFKKQFPIFNINYQIVIKKNIPIGSGLGGGSSNAACVLNFLLKENNLKLNEEQLLDIALNVGSDICFFLTNYEIAYVYELGNKIKPISNNLIPQITLQLNNIDCSTRKVYEKFDELNRYKQIRLFGFNNLVMHLKNKNYDVLFNNLTTASCKCYKALDILIKQLQYQHKNKKIILSGAGSSILLIKQKTNEGEIINVEIN